MFSSKAVQANDLTTTAANTKLLPRTSYLFVWLPHNSNIKKHVDFPYWEQLSEPFGNFSACISSLTLRCVSDVLDFGNKVMGLFTFYAFITHLVYYYYYYYYCFYSVFCAYDFNNFVFDHRKTGIFSLLGMQIGS